MADALLSVEVIAKMDQLSVGLRKAESEISGFVGRSNVYLNSLRTQLASIGFNASTTGARAFTAAMRDQSAEILKQNRALASLQSNLRQTTTEQKKLSDATKGSGSAMSAGRTEIGAFIASYLGLQGAIQATMFAFNQNIKVDAIKTSLTYLLGSAEEMEIRWSRLSEKANAYGLEVTTLGNAYQLFIGSAKAANQDLEIAEKVFYSLSKAGAVLHLSQEKVASSLYAVQQMMDKGTVQSEELKRQLGNSLPGAMAIMAKAVATMTGRVSVSNDELMKMMKNGEIISSEVLPYFADQIEKTFGIESVEKVESLQASVGNLQNALTDLVADGSKVSGFFQLIVDGLTHTTRKVNDLVNSSSWKEMVLRLFQPQNTGVADGIRDIAKAAEQVGKTAKRISGIDLFSMDKDQLKAEAAAIAKTLNGLVNPYNKATKDVSKGAFGYDPKTIKEAKGNYDYLQSRLGQIKALISKMPDVANQNKAKVTVETDEALTSIEDIKKRIAALSKIDGSAVKGSDIYDRIQALKARLSTKRGSTGPTAAEKAAEKSREDWEKKKIASREATADFIVNSIAALSAAEVKAEEDRVKALNDALAQGEIINDDLNTIINKGREDAAEAQATSLENYTDFVNDMIDETSRFIGDAVGQFAEGIGLMLAGELSFEDFGRGMLSSIGDFLASFGKQLIAFGAAAMLFTKLKAAIALGGPGAIPAAIKLVAAGIALTVIGSAISGAMGGGNSGSGGGGSVVPGFANGVTNFGGGLALVGERGPELVSLPRGSNVTPNSRTENMLRGSGGQVFIPDMVLKGEDIYISFKKTERRRERT